MEWLLMVVQLFVFIFLSQLTFTIPGYFLLKTNLRNDEPWRTWAISTIVGFVAFTLLSYVLTLLHLHIILLGLVLIIDFLYLRKQPLPKLGGKWGRFKFSHFILLSVGIIRQLLVIAPSGLDINGNLVFW